MKRAPKAPPEEALAPAVERVWSLYERLAENHERLHEELLAERAESARLYALLEERHALRMTDLGQRRTQVQKAQAKRKANAERRRKRDAGTELAKKVRRLRALRGWGEEAIARECEVSRSRVRRLLSILGLK